MICIRTLSTKSFLHAVVLLLTAACLPQCASTSTNTQTPRLDEHFARHEVDTARRLIDQSDYQSAVAHLQKTIEGHPTANATLEARYFLGMAYFLMDAHENAIVSLNDYLRMAPSGAHAADSREMIARLSAEHDQKFPSRKTLDTRIADLREQLADDPSANNLRITLADLLWKRTAYPEAGDVYRQIVEADPSFARSRTFADRIEVQPDGRYVYLTPQEINRRSIEREPLVIINTSSFLGGRQQFTQVPRYYIVTGVAANRSDKTLNGVEVDIAIYNFSNTVYDARTVRLGRLGPGASRAFSVRFTNFDDINNVDRFTCAGTFRE